MSSSDELDKMSATIGIDLNKLKEKYQDVRARQAVGPAAADGGMRMTAEEAAATQEALDRYAVCQSCQGSGIMRVVYNFMSLDKNCSECGGEGLLTTLETRVSAIQETLKVEQEAEAEHSVRKKV